MPQTGHGAHHRALARTSGGAGTNVQQELKRAPMPSPRLRPKQIYIQHPANAIVFTRSHRHTCSRYPPPLPTGTAGACPAAGETQAYCTTANACKSPCLYILIRAWLGGASPGPYTPAGQRQRHAHEQAQPGHATQQPGSSGLLRPDHSAQGQNRAWPCSRIDVPKQCSALTGTPFHSAQSRAVGSANA